MNALLLVCAALAVAESADAGLDEDSQPPEVADGWSYADKARDVDGWELEDLGVVPNASRKDSAEVITSPVFQINTFTGEGLKGSTVVVVPLDEWPPNEILQKVAADAWMATAFFAPEATQDPSGRKRAFRLRWFTPKAEVDMSSQATLAAGALLLKHLLQDADEITFLTNAGPLDVMLADSEGEEVVVILATWPAADAIETPPEDLLKTIGLPPAESYRIPPLDVLDPQEGQGVPYWLFVYETPSEVSSLSPRFRDLKATVICTASPHGRNKQVESAYVEGLLPHQYGDQSHISFKGVDFVHRVFGPASIYSAYSASLDLHLRLFAGEDDVTPNALRTLTPFWSYRLDKLAMTSRQLSSRGGEIGVELMGWGEEGRVVLRGRCDIFREGALDFIPIKPKAGAKAGAKPKLTHKFRCFSLTHPFPPHVTAHFPYISPTSTDILFRWSAGEGRPSWYKRIFDNTRRRESRSVRWADEWVGSLKGWWLATPFRDGLDACAGAMGIFLSRRLQQSYSTWLALRGQTPLAAPPPPPIMDQPGCEWIGERVEEIERDLPKFPDFNMLEGVELPELMPIPRLLPEPSWLQSRSGAQHATAIGAKYADASHADGSRADGSHADGALSPPWAGPRRPTALTQKARLQPEAQRHSGEGLGEAEVGSEALVMGAVAGASAMMLVIGAGSLWVWLTGRQGRPKRGRPTLRRILPARACELSGLCFRSPGGSKQVKEEAVSSRRRSGGSTSGLPYLQ